MSIRARVACQTLGGYRSIRRFLYAVDGLRSDIEKFYALESNLSKSPRSYVPYFCYLLSLRRSRQQGESPLRMLPPKRRSSFGTNCVRCDYELIAPERSEYRDEGQYVIFGIA